MTKIKSLQAKKVINKPDDLTCKYYEPERLVAQWQKEGKSQEDIRTGLIDYVTKERQKCFDDPIYFCTNYGFVIGHGSSGIIPFPPAPYQKEILAGVRKDKYSIAVKSRQLGVSTIIMFYCLWFSIFSPGKKTLVVSHKRESAEEFIAKLKTAYEFLPEWLKPAATLYSKSVVEFDTKSIIRAITSNVNAARSFSATLFVLDEAAFIENCDGVVTAILPTVAAADGKLIAISSPNGNSDLNWFYKTYTYAAAKLNTWTAYNFPYTVSPIFTADPLFREHQIQIDNGNVDKFEKEFCCRFDVNLASLFSQDVLRAFKINENILNRQLGGITYEDTLFIWKLAEQNKKYIIGVDCSSNKPTAKDFTAFQVLDAETQEQMAEYCGKLPTELFVDILIKTAKHYNTAELVIEENSYSQLVMYLLEQKSYKNLWYPDNKTTPGFNTNRNSRVLLLEKLILFYNNLSGIQKLKSARLKVQMENFSANHAYSDGSKKYEASKGNDDCFPAGTLITTDKGIKPIEEVLVGDLVLTHTGSYQKVLRTGNRQTTELFKLKAVGKPEILVTGEHPFYCYTRGMDTKSGKNTLCWNKQQDPWVKVEDLDLTTSGLVSVCNNNTVDKVDLDLLPYAVTSVKDINGMLESWVVRKTTGSCRNPKGTPIKRNIIVDNDFCLLLGYFMAEGSTGSHSISFASHKREQTIRDFVIDWFKSCGLTKYYEVLVSENGYNLTFNNITLRNFFHTFGSGNKKALPDWVMSLPVEKQKSILVGYLLGDGSFANGKISCATISKKAAYQLYELFIRCGYLVSLESPRISSNKLSKNPINTIRGGIPVANKIKEDLSKISNFTLLFNDKLNIDKTVIKDQTTLRFVDNFIVGGLTHLEKISKSCLVYNLEVEKDNSYVANSYVVHNCILALALAVVTLTPKEYFHRPELDTDASLMMSTELMTKTGEYSDEYLTHFSVLMGISKSSLAARLKLYHDIKSGMYDGSGLDDLSFVHPVEEWERTQAAADFLGMKNTQILSDLEFTNLESTTLPFGETYDLCDPFSEDLVNIQTAHRNFLSGGKTQQGGFW